MQIYLENNPAKFHPHIIFETTETWAFLKRVAPTRRTGGERGEEEGIAI